MGRPKTRGARLETPEGLAKPATWHTTTVRHYGRIDIAYLTEILRIRYGDLHTQTIRVILVRDDKAQNQR